MTELPFGLGGAANTAARAQAAGTGAVAGGGLVLGTVALGAVIYFVFYGDKDDPQREDEWWGMDIIDDDEQEAAVNVIVNEFEDIGGGWESGQQAETSYGILPVGTIDAGTAKCIAFNWDYGLNASVIPAYHLLEGGEYSSDPVQRAFGSNADNAGFYYELPEVTSKNVLAGMEFAKAAISHKKTQDMFGYGGMINSSTAYRIMDVYIRALLGGNVLRRPATQAEEDAHAGWIVVKDNGKIKWNGY